MGNRKQLGKVENSTKCIYGTELKCTGSQDIHKRLLGKLKEKPDAFVLAENVDFLRRTQKSDVVRPNLATGNLWVSYSASNIGVCYYVSTTYA